MNEKTKKILRYVACGLGGVALGIGLLGGLAMCASSGKSAKAESVNTILTKKNATITTDGGYRGYSFSVDNGFIEKSLSYGDFCYYTFSLDSSYNLTLKSSGIVSNDTLLFSDVSTLCDTYYTSSRSTDGNQLNFLACYFIFQFSSTGVEMYGCYYTFVLPSQTLNLTPTYSFLCTNQPSDAMLNMLYESRNIGRYASSDTQYILNYERSSSFVYFSSNIFTEEAVFQDVVSYYKELGYQDGYDAGYTDGESVGYSSGYADGYEAGESVGYSSGYADGFRTGYMNTYYAFTSLTANLNKVWNMAEIPWHRNTDILVTQDNFNDFPFFDIAHLQVGIYINWAYLALFRDTVTLTPYYVYAQRYTTSQNDGYNVCINIAPASQDTIQEDGNIGGTTGPYLLKEDSLFQLSHTTVWTAPNRCRLIGFMEDTEDIYTNWFDDGYLIPQGIEVDGNAYEEGYRQGQHDATNDTDIQNVFSLLTPAFTAVGGFFNLKVFGFLPLYWFFLAPLLVALITLIMRMVKH